MVAVKGRVRVRWDWVAHFAPVWMLVSVAVQCVYAAHPSASTDAPALVSEAWAAVTLIMDHPVWCRWCRRLVAQRSSGAYRHRWGLWLWHYRRWLWPAVAACAGGWVVTFLWGPPGPDVLPATAALGTSAAYRYAGTVHAVFRYWCLRCPHPDQMVDGKG